MQTQFVYIFSVFHHIWVPMAVRDFYLNKEISAFVFNINKSLKILYLYYSHFINKYLSRGISNDWL